VNEEVPRRIGGWFTSRVYRRVDGVNYAAIDEAQKASQPMKPKSFKNAEEFTSYIAHVTGKPFKAAASTDGTTAHKYLSGQRDYANL